MGQHIATEKVGARIYITGNSYAVKDRLKAAGCHWDGDRRQWWIGATKAAEIQAIVDGAASAPADAPKPAENLDDARVYAQVEYRGRKHYVIAESHEQGRCRITTLDGTPSWVDMADCNLVKTYSPREVGSGRYARTVYTTIGSLRSFRDSQRKAEAAGEPACAECGRRGGELVRDMEDGLMKHRHCCDMPPA